MAILDIGQIFQSIILGIQPLVFGEGKCFRFVYCIVLK